jgi:hypothetical protein
MQNALIRDEQDQAAVPATEETAVAVENKEEKGAIGIALIVWLLGGSLGLAVLVFLLAKMF